MISGEGANLGEKPLKRGHHDSHVFKPRRLARTIPRPFILNAFCLVTFNKGEKYGDLVKVS